MSHERRCLSVDLQLTLVHSLFTLHSHFDQIQDYARPPSWKIFNGHISATGHHIDFMFGSRVRFLGSVYQMDLLPVEPNPRDGRAPSSKIWNQYISGMGYPIHFHETERGFVGIWESIMCKK